jgi:leader peptidase (prepilin peptidase)/N-methyltransferase
MTPLTAAALVVAALPVAWAALMLVERIPDALPLLRPLPSAPLPRGRLGRDIAMYPLMAGAFLAAGWRYDRVLVLAIYCGVFALLLALSAIDIETLRLPDRLVLPSIVVGLAVIAVASFVLDRPAAIGAALTGAAMYFGVLFLAHLIHPRGMGFGDVKFAILMGLFLGWPTDGWLSALVVVVWAMFVGFAGGAVIGLGILLVRGRSSPFPFGPFLAFGSAVIMLLVPDLLPPQLAENLLF